MAVLLDSCVVCSKNENVKYKCPSCRAAYCSVNCCQEHKLKGCSRTVEQESANNESSTATATPRRRYEYETEDTVPLEQLEHLRNSANLRDILSNPHLRRLMEAIDRSEDSANLIGDAMREPIFTEMVDECLKIISGGADENSDDDF